MLFISEQLAKRREAIRKSVADEMDQARRLLEIDPDDGIAVFEMAQLEEQRGNLGEAERLYWRALEMQPCFFPAFLLFARFLAEDPERKRLATGLTSVAFGTLEFNSAMLDDAVASGLLGPLKKQREFRRMKPREIVRLMTHVARKDEENEPEDVTAILHPYRSILTILGDEELEPEQVDEILDQGSAMVPVLSGVLRCYARRVVDEEYSGGVAAVMALLGEIGDPRALRPLIEFAGFDDPELHGAASWAIRRMTEKDPAGVSSVLKEYAGEADAQNRLSIAEQLMLMHSKVPQAKVIAERLGENLERLNKEELDGSITALITMTVAVARKPGFDLARTMLAKVSHLLSPEVRKGAEGILKELSSGVLPPVEPAPPSPYSVYDICEGNVDWEDEEFDEDFDDDDDEAFDDEDFMEEVTPVRRQATPGRNDPCWCGSGKKYKKCHLAEDETAQREEPAAGPRPARPVTDKFGLGPAVGEFLFKATPKEERMAATHRFLGDEGAEQSDNVALVDWLVHDWTVPAFGRTVMQEYLHRNFTKLTASERETLENWSRSHISLYEVQEVERGSGLELKDLIEGGTRFVHDVSLSRSIVKWDAIFTRVIKGDRGHEVTGVGQVVPRIHIDRMLEWMEKDKRSLRLRWPEYFKANWPRIRHRLQDISAEWTSSIRLTNTDGEELQVSEARYRILDRKSLISALRGVETISEDSETHFTWLDGSREEPGHTVLGHLRMDRDGMVLECNSRQRLKRGKALLKEKAGSAISHTGDTFTSQQEMKSRARRDSGKEEDSGSEIPPEVEYEIISGFLEKHYAGWPDTKLPALNGKTPREAVKTPAGREKVAALLRDFENGEERNRQEGRPFYEVDRLRRALGLIE